MADDKVSPQGTPLPELAQALADRFPRLTFRCFVQAHEGRRGLTQTVRFSGPRTEVASFVPTGARVADPYHRYYDENGSSWTVLHVDNTVKGWWRVELDPSLDSPENARHWPLKGVEKEVARTLARIQLSGRRQHASGGPQAAP